VFGVEAWCAFDKFSAGWAAVNALGVRERVR